MSNLDLFSGKDKSEISIERLQAFCPSDDGQQESNEYKKSIPGTAPVTKGRRVV